MGILDDAANAARAAQADTNDRELETAHNDVKVLAGECVIWLEQIMEEANDARQGGKLFVLNGLEDLLREVKVIFDDHHTATTDGMNTATRNKPGTRTRARGWFHATFVEPLQIPKTDKKH